MIAFYQDKIKKAPDRVSLKAILIQAHKHFFNDYDASSPQVYFAPGRVNLIGEHTDYNGGHVFPCALPIGTYAAISLRDDDKLSVMSLNNDEGITSRSMTDIIEDKTERASNWASYVHGLVWALSQHGIDLKSGADILIYGDIPAGSGLSSSASLEVLIAYSLLDLELDYFNSSKKSREEILTMIAQISQYSENKYNGMNCGIMDQFASAFGSENQAIYLDTNSLAYSYVPFDLGDYALLVTNTNKKHKLIGSAYNDRCASCEEALKDLTSIKPELDALCSLTSKDFEEISSYIKNPEARIRAKHAVYENERTKQAVSLLKAGNLPEFGRLMYESHESLSHDYEVSCDELDAIVNIARTIPGVLGCRMTGGGFGGCTVAIIANDSIEEYKSAVEQAYTDKFGYAPSFYILKAGRGPYRL